MRLFLLVSTNIHNPVLLLAPHLSLHQGSSAISAPPYIRAEKSEVRTGLFLKCMKLTVDKRCDAYVSYRVWYVQY